MNATQREQLRISLLRFLGDAPTMAQNLGMLTQLAVSEGRRGLLQQEVETELQYLVDKGLATLAPKTLSPENKAWRITATGRDQLAESQGL